MACDRAQAVRREPAFRRTSADAGAGDERNRVHFKHCAYESADFQKVDKRYVESTYVCDLSSIPVDSARYDAIVFTQVMEHLPEPSKVVEELYRVLRPGGRLFYSAPLLFHEHEVPYDSMRYTQYGVRSIFERAGFRVPEVKKWLEGYLGTVSYEAPQNGEEPAIPAWTRGIAQGLQGVSGGQSS